MKTFKFALIALLGLTSVNAFADAASAQKLADKYLTIAKNVNPSATGLSAADGKAFYNKEIIIKDKPVACASCHTTNPAAEGKHIVTGKPIRPLSPVVNKKRFAELDKVEKNFTDHCNDIISRDCTAQEKGNFITYLLTTK